MKTESFILEFITPCFCAGADQSKAEIRAPSIRGQLRWWFRALGGSKSEESEVFGTTSGEGGNASAIQVRAVTLQKGEPWTPPRVDPSSSEAYVYFFASVSGKTKGQRWTEHGNIPPQTTVRVTIKKIRKITSKTAEDRLDLALKLWRTIGGMGLRITRGLGAFACAQAPMSKDQLEWTRDKLNSAGFGFHVHRTDLQSWQLAIRESGALLKDPLRANMKAGKKGDRPSPLGTSRPRQTSAVYLRPVKMSDGLYGLIIFEAPSEKVLGPTSRKGAPAIKLLA